MSPRRDRVRSLAQHTGVRVFGGLILVVTLLWTAVATGFGMSFVVPAVLGWATPEGWRVEVESVEGAWNSRVWLRGLTIDGPGASASIEGIFVEYRVTPLLSRRIELDGVRVVGPRLRADLTASPDTAAPAEKETTTVLETILSGAPLGAWTLDLDALDIRQAEAELVREQGTYDISDAGVIGSLEVGPSVARIALDALSAEVTPPEGWTPADSLGRAELGTGRLRLAAELRDGLLDVETLTFESPRSRLTGEGELLLVPEPSLVDRVDFQLVADPLDVRDLPVPLPEPWIEQPRLTAAVDARGAVDSMVVRATVQGPGEAAAEARAVIRTPADTLFDETGRAIPPFAAPSLEVTADVRGDLSRWPLGPLRGDVTAELDLRMDGLGMAAPAALDAKLVHRPATDTTSALLGRDLRLDLQLVRARAPTHVDSLSSRAGSASGADPLEVTTTLHRGVEGPEEWVRVGSLEAAGTTDRAAWELDLALDSGHLAGRGSVAWSGERPELVVERLEAEDLDFSGLLGTLPSTDLSGFLEGSVAGASIDSLRGGVTLRVAESSFGGMELDTASVNADLEPGVVAGALLAQLAGTEVRSDYRVALTDTLVSVTLPRVHAAALSAATTDTVVAELELDARASGSLRLGGPPLIGSVSLQVDSAAVAGLRVRGGSLDARLLEDSVTADATLRLDHLLGAPVVVDATVRTRGTTPAEMMGEARLLVTRPAARAAETGVERVQAAQLDSLVLTLDAVDPGQLALDGRLLPAEGGRIALEGTAAVGTDDLSFDLTLSGEVATPTDLLRQATLDTLLVSASGARDRGEWEALTGALLVRGMEWRGVRADTMRLVARADTRSVLLDTLLIDSEVLYLSGGGSLPTEGPEQGRIEVGAIFDPEPLAEVVEMELPLMGENELTASIVGTTDSMLVTTSAEMSGLVFSSFEMDGVTLQAEASLSPPFGEALGIASGAADLELRAVSLPNADLESVNVSLTGDPEEVRLRASGRVNDGRVADLEARVDPRPDIRAVTLERFDVGLGESDWQLTDTAVLRYGAGYELRSFELTSGEQAIRIDGALSAAGALDAVVEVDSTHVDAVSDLAGFPRLSGWVDGEVSLAGTLGAPRGAADMRAAFHVEERAPTIADIAVRSDEGRLLTDIELRDPSGGAITIGGSVPLAALEGAAPGEDTAGVVGPGPLDLEVAAASFDVSAALAFLDPVLVTAVQGQLDGRLAVSGTPDQPSIEGPLALRRGLILLPELGVPYEQIEITAVAQGATLVVDAARVRAGSGTLTTSGTVGLEDLALDLEVAMDEFQAVRTAPYRAAVSGDLQVSGELTAPVVAGEVFVESMDVYVGELEVTAPSGLEEIELSEEDLETLRRRFGYVPDGAGQGEEAFSSSITADLTVELSRDSWVRKRTAPEMAIAFTGEVEVRLRPEAEPLVEGTVTTIADRGYVQQFGKRFEVEEGTVTLAGPLDSMSIDASATYTVPSYSDPDNAEATIVLQVDGRPDALELTLTSDPPMENADIVSYIATGRPAGSALSLGGGDIGDEEAGEEADGGLAEAGAGLAISQIVGAVERAAQEGVGLDVIEIRREGIRSATLVAGKYLSPQLYVGFAQPVTHQQGDGLSLGDEGESEIELEYAALPGLLLNIEGSDSSLRLFIRGRFAY